MKLLQLTATFGCLQGDTLEFGPGMTLIGAPNGSGKSTCAPSCGPCSTAWTPASGTARRPRRQKPLPALERLPHGGAAGL